MIKIRQKQTKKVEWVTYDYYFHNVNKDLYETLQIKDLYELYNSKDGTERWQATLEKKAANIALHKHPDIFRIEYSDKNTLPLSDNIVSRLVKKYENEKPNVNTPQKNQVNDDAYLLENLLKNPDFTKKLKQNKIKATHKEPIITRIKSISFAEWGIIWTIIAGVIALWIYVLKPIIDTLSK